MQFSHQTSQGHWGIRTELMETELKTAQFGQNVREFTEPLDNAKAHQIKSKSFQVLDLPILLSFLFFYICFVNVIIKCDVSINDVNIKKHKEGGILNIDQYVREKARIGYGHKYMFDKNPRKGRISSKRNVKTSEKSEKYGSEDQELKYYDYFKSKADLVINITEHPTLLYMPKLMQDDLRALVARADPHELASDSYHVKKANVKLRPERHQFNEKIVKLGVLLPADPEQVFSLVKVLPILEMAVPAVTRPDGPLPGWKILVDYRDTGCSSVEGPLAAFEFYINGSAGNYRMRAFH